MTEPTLHPRKQLLFALLSAADFALTWWLLDRPDGHAFEANPVARWWLAHGGWLGLACFKAAVVCLVLGLATLIARFRPLAAGRVLKLGCVCVAAVVVYSAALGGTALWAADGEDADYARLNADLQEYNRQRAVKAAQMEPFRELVRQLRQDLLARRCTLREAADRLEDAEGHNPDVLRMLAPFAPDRPLGQRFASWIICHVASSFVNDLEGARRVVLRLGQEFQSGYGARPPRELRDFLECLRLDRDEADGPEEQTDLVRMP